MRPAAPAGGPPPGAPPLIDIAKARLRASARATLTPFERLSEDELLALGELRADPRLYGVVRDEAATVKVVDRDSALLLEALRDAAPVPRHAGADEATLARLVLDGLLEVETSPDEFASGPAAYEALYGRAAVPPATTKTARLSQAALRYGQLLDLDDALRLSVRLYFYNRLPLSPRWAARFPSRTAVARFLGVEQSGALARRLRRSWHPVTLQAPQDGWFLWAGRAGGSGSDETRFKVYVSPMPDAAPTALAAALEVGDETGAASVKVGNDAASLLRPDKIVLYFASFEQVGAAAALLVSRLAGCPGHGVPFTAELGGGDGLVSWGVDPPRSEHMLGWQERESWRLWVTNRLAVALVAARRDGAAVEPWRYALARAELDGVDVATWAPRGDPWAEAAAA